MCCMYVPERIVYISYPNAKGLETRNYIPLTVIDIVSPAILPEESVAL